MTSCEDKIRPIANHRRQSINKAHSIPYLKPSKKRLGGIKSYLHYTQSSIGVGFKILVGAPLFFPLDGQTKGEVVVGTTPYRRKYGDLPNEFLGVTLSTQSAVSNAKCQSL